MRLGGCNRLVLRDPDNQRRQNFEKSIGSRSLEGSSTLGKLGLEDLLIFMNSNLFTSGSISTWRVVERFFIEYFGFLFDNTSSVILYLHHCGVLMA